jgi:transposase-like protein
MRSLAERCVSVTEREQPPRRRLRRGLAGSFAGCEVHLRRLCRSVLGGLVLLSRAFSKGSSSNFSFVSDLTVLTRVESAERERLKELERENRELKRANEILRKASAFFAQAELDRRPK